MDTQTYKTLHQMAVEYLRANKGTWPTICAETGLGYDWVSKLAQGAYSDPGVNKIEKLLVYAGVFNPHAHKGSAPNQPINNPILTNQGDSRSGN